MNMKPMEGPDRGDMPPADMVESPAPETPAAGEMPSGAMLAGDSMSVDAMASETSGTAGEMPGAPELPVPATQSMPLGGMSEAGGAYAEAGNAALAVDMPAGLMDVAAGMSQALGSAASADAAVMELAGQWRMSFWVSPKS